LNLKTPVLFIVATNKRPVEWTRSQGLLAVRDVVCGVLSQLGNFEDNIGSVCLTLDVSTPQKYLEFIKRTKEPLIELRGMINRCVNEAGKRRCLFTDTHYAYFA